MAGENVGEKLQGLEIDPKTGWFLEVLDVAQKINSWLITKCGRKLEKQDPTKWVFSNGGWPAKN